MEPEQGQLALLKGQLAQELLQSAIPARLAYVWPDGSPRVIPIWFYWTGEEVLLCSPPLAPKMKALAVNPQVALTIDHEDWPARALMIRGRARWEPVVGEVPEYAAMTRKYLGEEASLGWREQYRQMFPNPVRISVRPEWAGIIDVRTDRFPSAIVKAMAG